MEKQYYICRAYTVLTAMTFPCQWENEPKEGKIIPVNGLIITDPCLRQCVIKIILVQVLWMT